MIENKYIESCSMDVSARIDTLKPATQQAIQSNKLKLRCPKTNEVVKLDTKSLFGYPLQISCLNVNCPYNTKNLISDSK